MRAPRRRRDAWRGERRRRRTETPASASAAAGLDAVAHRVKLTQKVQTAPRRGKMIGVDRREREAAALERFVEKKAKALRGGPTKASRRSGHATREEELSSALRDSGAVNERGESAGDRLRRLFAERRARGWDWFGTNSATEK